jgi:hypothetical protein
VAGSVSGPPAIELSGLTMLGREALLRDYLKGHMVRIAAEQGWDRLKNLFT